MTAVCHVVKPVSQMRLAPGSAVTIPNVNWEEFESILQELGEKRSARVPYSKGTLEIMVPLPEHEISRDLISDLGKTYIKSDISSTFPDLPLTHIIPATVERAWQVGSVQALEELEDNVSKPCKGK